MALYFNRVHNHSHIAVTVGVEDPKLQIRGGGGGGGGRSSRSWDKFL